MTGSPASWPIVDTPSTRFDHRGHGRTAARATGGGRSGPGQGMDGVLDDIRQLASLAESEAGRGPVVLFGHSMGTLLAQAYAERHGDELQTATVQLRVTRHR